MLRRRLWISLSLCFASAIFLAVPAWAAHAYAMVCCGVPSSVSVIDRTTHRTTATLIAGEGAAFAAVTPDGKTVYVTNENDQTISVLDAATGVQTATVSLSVYGASPYAALFSPDGTTLYIAAVQNGSLCMLAMDTLSNAVLFDVELPGAPEGYISPIPAPPPVISRDGQTIYLIAGSLIIFNTATLASETISLPSGVQHPHGVVVTPDGAYAMVTYNGGGPFVENRGQFAQVDLSSGAVVAQITYGQNVTFGAVAISPDGSRAYFPANDAGQVAVQVYDVASQQIVDTFFGGNGGGGAIAVTPDGSEIEVGESNSVLSINATTGAVIARPGTPGEMISITVSADGTEIYVPNFNSSMVEVIDPTTSQITGQIPSGWTGGVYDTVYTMEVSADGRRAAVMGAGSLSILNTETPGLIGVVPIAGAFGSVAISPHGDRAYAIIGAPSGSVAQIQVVSTAALRVAGIVNLTSADRPTQAAVSPDSATLYVGENYCPAGGSCVPQILTIDTATLTVTGQISFGASGPTPGGIVIAKDGATAYVVSDYYTSSVWAVDLTKGQVVATIPVGFGGPIALGPSQKLLYELATSNYFFYIINLPTGQVAAVPDNVGVYWGYAADMALSPDGTFVYLTSETDAYIVAYSMASGTPTFLTTIALPSATNGVGFSKF